jgi:hypothetical protein
MSARVAGPGHASTPAWSTPGSKTVVRAPAVGPRERRPASSSSGAEPVPGTTVRSAWPFAPAGRRGPVALPRVPWPVPVRSEIRDAHDGGVAHRIPGGTADPLGDGSVRRAAGAAPIRASREGPRAASKQSAEGRGRNWSAERSAGGRRSTVGGEPGSGRGRPGAGVRRPSGGRGHPGERVTGRGVLETVRRTAFTAGCRGRAGFSARGGVRWAQCGRSSGGGGERIAPGPRQSPLTG